MFCPNCGKEVVHAGAFCIYCGGKLPTLNEPAAPAPQPAAPAPQPAAPAPQPAAPAQRPAAPAAQPAAPAQQPAAPAPQPAAPAQQPAAPAAQPAAPAQRENAPESKPAAPVAPPVHTAPPTPPKKKGGKTGLIIAIAVVVVLAIAAAVIFLPKLSAKTGGGKNDKAYDLGKYLTVEYDGYDGYAVGELEFDRDRLMRDICEERKIDPAFLTDGSEPPKAVADIYNSLPYAEPYVRIDEDSFSSRYYGTNERGAKNGDTFDVVILYDVKAESGLLRFEDAHVTVSGLPSIPQYDPFIGLELLIEGVNGSNFVECDYHGDAPNLTYIDFNVEPYANVKNGDTVTVRLNYDPDTCVDLYGFYPTKTEVEYTVEGLSTYVTSFDEISKVALEQLKQTTKENMQEELTKLNGKVSYTEPNCIGYVFSQEQSPDKAEDNTLYLVFRSEIDSVNAYTAPRAFFYAEAYDRILNTDDISEHLHRRYGTNSLSYIAGTFIDGIDDPWEFVSDLKQDAADNHQTLSYGGEMSYYSEGDGTIKHLSDIDLGGLVSIRSYAAGSITTLMKENEGKTVTETPECLGEYLIHPTNTDKADMTILLLMLSVRYTDTDGVSQTVYVPFQFDGVRNLSNALLIANISGPMKNQNGSYGYPTISIIHPALLQTGQTLGEIEYSDSIKALVGE